MVPPRTEATDGEMAKRKGQGWLRSLFGRSKDIIDGTPPSPEGIARRPMEELSESENRSLDGYYVRLRYNDKVMQVPGCKLPGKHLDGDESFCTLVSSVVSRRHVHNTNSI